MDNIDKQIKTKVNENDNIDKNIETFQSEEKTNIKEKLNISEQPITDGAHAFNKNDEKLLSDIDHKITNSYFCFDCGSVMTTKEDKEQHSLLETKKHDIE